jgi:hypothetical protein
MTRKTKFPISAEEKPMNTHKALSTSELKQLVVEVCAAQADGTSS